MSHKEIQELESVLQFFPVLCMCKVWLLECLLKIMWNLDGEQVTTARNAAEADVELVRSELRTTRALLEHSEGEVSRLKEGGEQAREHIATLHTSLSKSEEDLKLQREDNNRWRSMVRDIEEFEQAQARLIQGHVEKLRCARQFCPC
jgi:septal ring factor EnvC (AmiA/AmiB activator)